MSHSTVIRWVVALLILATVYPASLPAQTNADLNPRIFWLKSPVPLGAKEFVMHPSGRKFYILSCLDDQRFNRLQVSRVQRSPFVIDAAGRVWKNYPDTLTFRVTATAMDSELMDVDSSPINAPEDLNSFLLGLRFRLKGFHALEITELKPTAVRLIGVPADIPYKERIYRVSFATGQFPVDERLVMEVLSPDGKLLSRFHLELE